MNPWILWLIKSVYGVVWRDSMLVFDENWNGRELWKKSKGKRVNSAISGQNRTLVPVTPRFPVRPDRLIRTGFRDVRP